ncbi:MULTISPECIES: chemotaxis protein CheW [unclassified Brevundimonas]|uniref:chemotaxis protein CheW n=1 Tax=unclassified Brevundimonas TaxID=2622653 RepID=UPI003F8ECD13
MSGLNDAVTAPGWTGGEQVEVLTFELNGELFALDAVRVQEIIDLAPETAVPGAGAFAGSVINFRGKVIPLADLREVFDLKIGAPTIDSRIVVIEMTLDGEQALVGLRTDKVHEVTTLERAASEAPPSVGMRWRPEFIQCLVRRDTEFIVVPELQTIFNQHQDARPSAASLSRH